MSLLSRILVLCIFGSISLKITGAQQSFENTKTVHLSVYYESLCPDSEDFVVDQLLPQVMLYPELLKVKFIPFGKAYSTSIKSFRCQHGPPECAGNLFQDCALNLMQNQTTLARTIYVACELKTRSSVYGKYKKNNVITNCLTSFTHMPLQRQLVFRIKANWYHWVTPPMTSGLALKERAKLLRLDPLQCVIEANVPPLLVKRCVENDNGIYLQKISERETFKVQRPLKFVPTVTFNGVFDQRIQDLSMKDLKRVLQYKLKSKTSTL